MIDDNSNNSEVIPDQEEEIHEVPIEEINIEPETIEEITPPQPKKNRVVPNKRGIRTLDQKGRLL